MHLLAILASALSGVFMALQGLFNAKLAEKASLFRGNLYVHLIALLLAFMLFIFLPHPVLRTKLTYTDLLGGVLAPAIILLVAYGIALSGTFKATIAIVAAQTLAAALLDNFGLFGLEKKPLSWLEIGGAILIIFGVYLVLRSK